MALTPQDTQAVADAVWTRIIGAVDGVGPASAEDWLRSTRIIVGGTSGTTQTVPGRLDYAALGQLIADSLAKAILNEPPIRP